MLSDLCAYGWNAQRIIELATLSARTKCKGTRSYHLRTDPLISFLPSHLLAPEQKDVELWQICKFPVYRDPFGNIEREDFCPRVGSLVS